MAVPISVIFVAGADELSTINYTFGSKYNIKLVLKTDDHVKAFETARELTHPVVVLRVRELGQVKELTAKLNERKIIYICICMSAKEGFVMLQNGAAEMLTRENLDFKKDLKNLENMLSAKIKSAHAKYFEENLRKLKHEYGAFDKIIVIGSSTGGTETVLELLKSLPADVPPILIVQHMPPVFTRLYAERLNSVCKMSVWEAQDGDVLKRGLVLLAPGDFQMRLKSDNGGYSVSCEKGEKENGHCPSVDVLFHSVARTAGSKAIGVILTGMGGDGARGLLAMRQHGAMTFGQDEASCVVYGMPKVAYDIGAVVNQLPANAIANAIMECL